MSFICFPSSPYITWRFFFSSISSLPVSTKGNKTQKKRRKRRGRTSTHKSLLPDEDEEKCLKISHRNRSVRSAKIIKRRNRIVFSSFAVWAIVDFCKAKESFNWKEIIKRISLASRRRRRRIRLQVSAFLLWNYREEWLHEETEEEQTIVTEKRIPLAD